MSTVVRAPARLRHAAGDVHDPTGDPGRDRALRPPGTRRSAGSTRAAATMAIERSWRTMRPVCEKLDVDDPAICVASARD